MVAGELSDGMLLCRGGLCNADKFMKGAERVNIDGSLQGVSVFGKPGMGAKDLGKLIPHSEYGVSSVGAVRSLGGNVVQQGNNLNHYIINGLTPQQLESLFRPTILNIYR